MTDSSGGINLNNQKNRRDRTGNLFFHLSMIDDMREILEEARYRQHRKESANALDDIHEVDEKALKKFEDAVKAKLVAEVI